MKKIGLLSDTHGFWDNAFIKYFSECDEIWHAGDIGNIAVTDKLQDIAPVKAVYGNIDDHILRQEFQENLTMKYGKQKIFMTHIGGKPFKYNKKTLQNLQVAKPQIFICGHSHICKVMYDHQLKLLYINPGAAGIVGFHKVRTLIRFEIHEENVKNMEVIELKNRKKIT